MYYFFVSKCPDIPKLYIACKKNQFGLEISVVYLISSFHVLNFKYFVVYNFGQNFSKN